MRIVIDMQGCQSLSRYRGISRYTLSFAQAVVRNRGEHEVILAFSGLFPDTIASLRAAFDGMLPPENMRVWHAPGPLAEIDQSNAARLQVAERIREAFLASLAPDVVHVMSLFEGHLDDSVTNIHCLQTLTPITVMLYDLIPLVNPDQYLKPNPSYARYYYRKLESMKKASVYFAISAFSRQEGIEHLGVSPDSIVNVSTAIESNFTPMKMMDNEVATLKEKLGVNRPFVLYTGGADERKNLPRLIRAYAALNEELRREYQMVFVGKMSEGGLSELQNLAKANGLKSDDLLFSGYVSNSELERLYNLAELFVFPSWHEGFGLPALEAMACGTPVIGANASSLPEVIGLPEALFDPFDVQSICNKMTQALNDADFRQRLSKHGLEQAQQFSWDRTATRAWAAWEALQADDSKQRSMVDLVALAPSKPKLAYVSPLLPDQAALADQDAKLLPLLADYYQVYLIRESSEVSDSEVLAYCEIQNAAWLREHEAQMHHVLYQMANSSHYAYVLDLMQECPGTVVLHDVGFGALMRWLEEVAEVPYAWTRALYKSHGYRAVQQRFIDADQAQREYSVSLPVLRAAQGGIMHSTEVQRSAQQYVLAIEQARQRMRFSSQALITDILPFLKADIDELQLKQLATLISTNMPPQPAMKCLFLDITATHHLDLKTGIQRVTRALMLCLLQSPLLSYRVEPVYLVEQDGVWVCRYAREYTLQLLGVPLESGVLTDEVVDFQAGDVLLGLDLSGPDVLQAYESGFLDRLGIQGVKRYFMVYDLLPVRLPEVFPENSDYHHTQWLKVVAAMDGAIGISQTVAQDFAAWYEENGFSDDKQNLSKSYLIDWIHLGADVSSSAPSTGVPDEAVSVLAQLAQRPSFLMVGTIEPRKGYLQVIDAFTELWAEGVAVNLVIVGREGWTLLPDAQRRDIPQTVELLRTHPQLNKQLFWMEGASDEYLEKLYATSTCLIAASSGEGFGLPLIEAAQYGIPILARDLPIFREVAAEHAHYFTGFEPTALAAAVQQWLSLYQQDQHPKSEAMPWLTWEQSAEQLLNRLGLTSDT